MSALSNDLTQCVVCVLSSRTIGEFPPPPRTHSGRRGPQRRLQLPACAPSDADDRPAYRSVASARHTEILNLPRPRLVQISGSLCPLRLGSVQGWGGSFPCALLPRRRQVAFGMYMLRFSEDVENLVAL
jgi:hypothetical protein